MAYDAAFWPPMGANPQYDLDAKGRFPIYSTAAKNGVDLTDMWYGGGPTSQSRINAEGSPRVVQQFLDATPGLKVLRILMNQFQFTGANGGYYDVKSQVFMDSLIANGFKILWVLMDGPSQRAYDHEPGTSTNEGTVPGTQYWTHYPDGAVIDADRVGSIGYVVDAIYASQQLAWSRLMNYLKQYPDIFAATIGFECINEPNTYATIANIGGNDIRLDEALGYYAEHNLAIIDLIDTAFPGNNKDIYIGGWRYSADINLFYSTPVSTHGGRTIYQIFAERLGGFGKIAGHRGVWSAHMYPQWTTGYPTEMSQLETWARQRFGEALDRGHRVAVTEFNAQNSHYNNPSYVSESIRKGLMWSRFPQFFAENDIGMYWWPLTAWASGSIYDARGSASGWDNYHQNSLQAFINIAAYENPDWRVGIPETGIRTAKATKLSRVSLNDPTDPDYALKYNGTNSPDIPIQFALGFGGDGESVVQPDQTCNNYLYGNKGRATLYGSTLYDDFLSLGRGGGVIRCYGGFNVANTNGGNNLIYTGSEYTLVTCYWGQTTVVVDPAAETIVLGWSPLKGDRLSFLGQVSPDDFTAGKATYREEGNKAGEIDLLITFPQGGTLRMMNCGYLNLVLYTYVLDYTDGWYNSTYQEPADYNPADFAKPIVTGDPPLPAIARAPLDVDGQPFIIIGPNWEESIPRNAWNPDPLIPWGT